MEEITADPAKDVKQILEDHPIAAKGLNVLLKYIGFPNGVDTIRQLRQAETPRDMIYAITDTDSDEKAMAQLVMMAGGFTPQNRKIVKSLMNAYASPTVKKNFELLQQYLAGGEVTEAQLMKSVIKTVM